MRTDRATTACQERGFVALKPKAHRLKLFAGKLLAQFCEDVRFLFFDVMAEQFVQHFGVRLPIVRAGIELTQTLHEMIGDVMFDIAFSS